MLLLAPSAWSLAARILLPSLMLALVAAAVWGYGVRERRAGRAEVRAEWADAKERQRAVDAAERERREDAHQEIARDAQEQTRRARADRDAAARTADGLRSAAAAALGRRCDPAPAAPGTPASDPAAVLADVLGGLEGAARELAAIADERGTAGAACVRSYESLTP